MSSERDLVAKVFAICAAVMFVAGLVQMLAHISDMSAYVKTEGIICDSHVSRGRGSRMFDGSFQTVYDAKYTVDGEEYTHRVPHPKGDVSIGDTVTVMYRRGDPTDVLMETGTLSSKPVMSWIVGGVMLLLFVAVKSKDWLEQAGIRL